MQALPQHRPPPALRLLASVCLAASALPTACDREPAPVVVAAEPAATTRTATDAPSDDGDAPMRTARSSPSKPGPDADAPATDAELDALRPPRADELVLNLPSGALSLRIDRAAQTAYATTTASPIASISPPAFSRRVAATRARSLGPYWTSRGVTTIGELADHLRLPAFDAAIVEDSGEVTLWLEAEADSADHLTVVTPRPCTADADGDGRIGPDDLATFAEWYAGSHRAADCNNDGTVNNQDFQLFLDHYTGGC